MRASITTKKRCAPRAFEVAFSERVRQVGAALNKVIPKVCKREDIFITSKLWNNSHAPEDVEPALDECLEQLGLDYLDLFCAFLPTMTVLPTLILATAHSGTLARSLPARARTKP